MKASIMLLWGLFILLPLSGCEQNTLKNLTFIKVDVGSNDWQYSEVKARYDSLWMGYRFTGQEYINGLGEKESILRSIVIGFKRGDSFVPLAWYLDNGKLLDARHQEIPTPAFSDTVDVMGISSATLESPLTPIYVVRDKSTGKVRSVDPSAILDIDFEANTLKLKTGAFD